MAQAYTDLLLRIFPFDEREQTYPVEAELDDGSRFTGGRLRLDRDALLGVELDPKAYGLLLFNALFAGDIRRAYDKATGAAEVQSAGRLRVRLWVDNAAVELHALGWERLYHIYRGRAVPLTTSTLTPFSRYTSLEMRDPPPVSEKPVRLAIAVANPLELPGGMQPVDVAYEVENLRQALGDLPAQGQFQVTLLPGRTGLTPELRQKVEGAGWQVVDGHTDLDSLVRLMTGAHIFHFIGHGHFRRRTEHGPGQAALFLEKPDGRWQAVTDDEIVATVTSAGTLPHLIFLVACESATRESQAESPFVGLGPKLVQSGVPAVVAMQKPVPMHLAQQLSGEFFRRLLEHGEVDQALNQARLIVFDQDRTDWAIPVLFMRTQRGKLFGEPEGDEEAPAPGAPPYKGLEFFDERDADKFFGREALVARLAGQLRDSRFLAVILGASGSGKSSVVRAGLIPALRRGRPLFDESLPPKGSSRWPIHLFTPGAAPLEALAATLTRAESSVTATAIVQEDMQSDPRALHLHVRKMLSREESAHLLLVVDQFEELFTLCKDEAQRRAFVDNLIYASNEAEDGPTVVVIIFRADFYAHCAQYANLREAVSRRQEFIGPMNQDELRRAIEEPARQGGWELEPGLVDVLLQDVGDEPGALPLLQHALLETWHRRRGRRMTLRGYTESGGIRGAIAKTAEAVYQQLPPEQQAVARRIFLRLVELGEGTQDTRRRAALAELSPRPEDRPGVEAVLKTLVDHRLVTTTAESAEVSHEALIREWPTLREWLDKNRAGIRTHRELAAAAKDWDSLLREPGGLYRGVRLVQALEWGEENTDELSTLEAEFLKASRAEAEREAREKEEQQRRELEAAQRLAEAEKKRAEDQERAASQLRRRAVYLFGALGVAGLAMVVAVWFAGSNGLLAARNEEIAQTAQAASTQSVANEQIAVTERAQAVTQEALANAASTQAVEQQAIAVAEAERAEANARAAFARGLAAAAVSSLEADPERSLLLALQALAPGDTLDSSARNQAVEALHRGLATSRLQAVLATGAVYESVAYSPAGDRLAAGDEDGQVTVWDLTSGQTLWNRAADVDFVSSLAFSPDGTRLAVVGADGLASLWDAATGEDRLAFEGHTGTVDDVDFSPDGALLVTGGDDATLRIWNAASGAELFRIPTPANVLAVAYSPDGSQVAAGHEGGAATVWSAASGRLVFTVEGHNGDVLDLAYSPDGSLLATVSNDQAAFIWDTATGEPQAFLTGHTDWVTGVIFTADGQQLITSSIDGTARVWDLATTRQLYAFSSAAGNLNGVAIRDDGSQVATVGNAVRLWRPGPVGESLVLTSPAGLARRVAFSPDGTRLAASGSDQAFNSLATVWDAATGEELFSLAGHADVVLDVAYSPDGTRLATASYDGTARLWDAATGQPVLTLAGHQDVVRGLAFSPDGTRLVTGSSDDSAIIWDAVTGEQLHSLRGHDTNVNGVAFSSTGLVATASDDGLVMVWEAGTGTQLGVLEGHSDWVIAVAFSPDGALLASSSQDRTIKLWDMATGDLIHTLTGHTAAVAGLAISADGKFLASAGAERNVKVWDLSTNRLLYTLYGHDNRVRGVAFSRDGTRLASAAEDGRVRVYILPVDELIEVGRQRVTRGFTDEECETYSLAPCPGVP